MDHYVKIARQRAISVAYGLRPSAIRGRFTGPRVLLNSIPKAGTHLLGSAMRHFPLMRDITFRTLRGWDYVPESTWGALRRIGLGAFKEAHLPAHADLIERLPQMGIRHLLMIRDPRDVAISNYRYVTYSQTHHFMHKAFTQLPDDNARLLGVINGIPGVIHSSDDVMRRFLPWLSRDDVLVVRFEDLVGARGEGCTDRQKETIARIADFLEIPLAKSEVDQIAERTFSTKSATFVGGRSGGWRSMFAPEHIAASKARQDDLLIRYGYETTVDW